MICLLRPIIFTLYKERFEDQMILCYIAYTVIIGGIRYGKNHCGN